MAYVRTPEGFFSQGQSGLVPITDPVQLRDLSSGQAGYIDQTSNNPTGNPNYGYPGTIPQVASPVTTQASQPQAPAVPQTPPPGAQPAQQPVQNPTAAQTAQTQPTDPYSKFSQSLMQILTNAQQAGNNSALYASRDQMNNQALNLSNPLNATPYQNLFAAQAPLVSLASQQDTQQAFQPGITSINSQIQAGNDAASRFAQLAGVAEQLPIVQQQKAVRDTVMNLAQSYPDAGISPYDDLQTAQQKATNSDKYQASLYTLRPIADPLTGQITYVYTKSPNLGRGQSGSVDVGGGTSAAPVSDVTQPKQNPLASAGAPAGSGGLPTPANKVQLSYEQDFTHGKIGTQINAINTAIGHLFEADQAFSQLQNGPVPLLNTIKNKGASAVGQQAQQNYEQAQKQFSAEISAAYGADALSDRIAQQAIGGSANSPSQHQGFVTTAGRLLASKITSQAQQYQTAMGAPLPSLDLILSPQNQKSLLNIGLGFKLDTDGSVVTYQLGADGKMHKI